MDLLVHHVDVLPWPAMSQDLYNSPIEHCWDELGRRVRRRQHPPRDQLSHAWQEEWAAIPQAVSAQMVVTHVIDILPSRKVISGVIWQ